MLSVTVGRHWSSLAFDVRGSGQLGVALKVVAVVGHESSWTFAERDVGGSGQLVSDRHLRLLWAMRAVRLLLSEM